MRTGVLITCSGCGDVTVPVDDVTVDLCEDRTDLTVARFVCPSCTVERRLPVRPSHVMVLGRAGAQIVRWHVPAEMWEHGSGEPLTPDDLLDLGIALADLPDTPEPDRAVTRDVRTVAVTRPEETA